MSLKGMQASWCPGATPAPSLRLCSPCPSALAPLRSLSSSCRAEAEPADGAGAGLAGGRAERARELSASIKSACSANPHADEIPLQLEEMHMLLSAKD